VQYHEVKINIDIQPIQQCLWAVKSLTATSGTQTCTTAYQQSLVAASLYVDYIFLDTDERRKMAQNPHEYLIEQLQFTGDESVGSSSNKIKLNFNHPCKELIWVVQPDSNVDYCSSLEGGTLLYKALGAQPFNYTDAVDALPNAIHAFGGQDATSGTNGFINASGLFQMAGAVKNGLRPTRAFTNLLATVPTQAGTLALALMCLMLAHSFSPKLRLICIAGVRTLWLRPNFNSTAKTGSLNVKVRISTKCNLTNTTPETPMWASMFIPSL
jgi:hypothetical protein